MPADLVTLDTFAPAGQADAESEKLSTLPILLLNVHEHCNCRCLMCDIWQRKDGRELDLAVFAQHRESIRRLGVQQVVLTGGEPLLHCDFRGLCNFLRDCGVRITLLSTGLLLSKHAKSVADGVDEIIVSLDGPKEVHDQIRRVKGAYELILLGIEAVRLRKPDMRVCGRSTVQKANHHLLRQTVTASKTLALDSISFLAADLTSQAFNRELAWPQARQAQIGLSLEEVEALEAEVDALVRDHADDIRTGYVVESPAKLRRIARRFRESVGALEPVAPLCNAPWVSAVVEVDGSVRPCFFHRSIGNANSQSLDQVINGPAARQFRVGLDVSTNETCRRCVCSLHYVPAESTGRAAKALPDRNPGSEISSQSVEAAQRSIRK